jgi:aminoglycoside phosphotransferase (APT) family kinase protein
MVDEALDLYQLARIVAEHVDCPPDRLKLRRCSTGKFNTTFFVDGARKPLVLRIAPPDDRSSMLFYEHRMMRQEPSLHKLLAKQTNIPVPKIIASDFGHAEIDRDYLIMERLAGTPISERSDITAPQLNNALMEVGFALRQCHRIEAYNIQTAMFGYLGEHQPMVPQLEWIDAFTLMWNMLIDDTVGCGGYSAEEGDDMRRLLDRHIRAFQHYPTSCLLHMDVWAQNILTDEFGRVTGLLDWDRALWGDPEIEFAVLDYCGISKPSFWEGYGRERDTSDEAEIRRQFYLLYELQKYILIRRVRSGDAAAAERFRVQSFQMAEQLR